MPTATAWKTSTFARLVRLPNRLFIQQPDGTAIERAAEIGVDWLEPSHRALLVDLDNDGDQDLLVSTTGRAAGDGKRWHGPGLPYCEAQYPAARNAYSLSAADYDNDGDLDVFACIYLAEVRHREILAIPVPFHDAKNGGRNVLLRNDGAWRIDDVTRETGLEPEATRRSFAVVVGRLRQDGDMDFYVANDYGRNNLFRNDGGRFVDVAHSAGVEDQSFGMSISWGDYNRDGWMDMYVSNMFSAAGNRIVYQRQFRATMTTACGSKFQYMARGNSLFQNTGHGTFQDVSLHAAINVAYWAWGSHFVDLNNDGRAESWSSPTDFLTRERHKRLVKFLVATGRVARSRGNRGSNATGEDYAKAFSAIGQMVNEGHVLERQRTESLLSEHRRNPLRGYVRNLRPRFLGRRRAIAAGRLGPRRRLGPDSSQSHGPAVALPAE